MKLTLDEICQLEPWVPGEQFWMDYLIERYLKGVPLRDTSFPKIIRYAQAGRSDVVRNARCLCVLFERLSLDELLQAAIYLNHRPLVESILTSKSEINDQAYQMALQRKRTELLPLFQ